MNTRKRYAVIFALVLLGVALVAVTWAAPGNAPLAGGAPAVVAYQGEVQVDGSPYNGNGYLKFAVVNAAGNTTYWSNDGTSTSAGEPAAAVQLVVSDGLFSVLLGDTALGGMTQALTADAFDEPDRYLRVWFSASGGGPFSQLTPDTRIAAVPYALQAERVQGYAGVVVVAKSGGDYTSVQAAIDSITSASASNPYLVWVAPGVYAEQVMIKPYVHLQGAGQEVTVITSNASSSAWPPDQATLVLASNTSLRDLTVSNNGTGVRNVALMATSTANTHVADVTARSQGGGTVAYAIYLNGSGADVTLQQVTALAENGTSSNLGLFNFVGATATLYGGTFAARGGADAYGILNSDNGAVLEAVGVTALAENAVVDHGLHNEAGAVATLRGGSFTARDGADDYGIINRGSGTMLEATDVTALGENGSDVMQGLDNDDGALLLLHGGSFTGRGGTNAHGIHNDANTTLEAEGITALAENGSNANYGLHNEAGAAATLRGGSCTARGGTIAYGIHNNGAFGSGTALDTDSISSLAQDGSSANYGLYNLDGGAVLRGGSFTGSKGTNAYGLYNRGSFAGLRAENITALGQDASGINYGLYNRDTLVQTTVTQGVLAGATNSVYRHSGLVNVSNTRLIGGAVSGTVTCVAVSRGNTFNANGCP